MSFADLLKNARSTPVTALHKFLTNYDPQSDRTHAFVEGAPDVVFYRSFLERRVSSDDLRMYNCEGKPNVYETFRKVVERFPSCRRVMFFVDKDIDDITGESLPADPRIYVTETYSVENYLVSKESVNRYLLDFVKIRRVTFDLTPIVNQFDDELKKFYNAVLPIIGWIVTVRRSGQRPMLTGIAINKMFSMSGSGVVRVKHSHVCNYMTKTTGVQFSPKSWRLVKRTCAELKRQDPKRYVRGKFEAWFFVEYVKRVVGELDTLARQSGGSISVNAQLQESNCIQLLVGTLAIPPSLELFLNFHVQPQPAAIVETKQSWFARLRGWFTR